MPARELPKERLSTSEPVVMKAALREAVPAGKHIPMCDEEKNRIVATQRAPAGLVADLLMPAETELAAFYTAVVRRYGPEEARRAAYDWIEEMETMNWPSDAAALNWRHVSIAAANCLSSRVIGSSQNS
jgi:hypothetical protein